MSGEWELRLNSRLRQPGRRRARITRTARNVPRAIRKRLPRISGGANEAEKRSIKTRNKPTQVIDSKGKCLGTNPNEPTQTGLAFGAGWRKRKAADCKIGNPRYSLRHPARQPNVPQSFKMRNSSLPLTLPWPCGRAAGEGFELPRKAPAAC
jgi:hypothetical protein